MAAPQVHVPLRLAECAQSAIRPSAGPGMLGTTRCGWRARLLTRPRAGMHRLQRTRGERGPGVPHRKAAAIISAWLKTRVRLTDLSTSLGGDAGSHTRRRTGPPGRHGIRFGLTSQRMADWVVRPAHITVKFPMAPRKYIGHGLATARGLRRRRHSGPVGALWRRPSTWHWTGPTSMPTTRRPSCAVADHRTAAPHPPGSGGIGGCPHCDISAVRSRRLCRGVGGN